MTLVQTPLASGLPPNHPLNLSFVPAEVISTIQGLFKGPGVPDLLLTLDLVLFRMSVTHTLSGGGAIPKLNTAAKNDDLKNDIVGSGLKI